jgi:hypothetical protein
MSVPSLNEVYGGPVLSRRLNGTAAYNHARKGQLPDVVSSEITAIYYPKIHFHHLTPGIYMAFLKPKMSTPESSIVMTLHRSETIHHVGNIPLVISEIRPGLPRSPQEVVMSGADLSRTKLRSRATTTLSSFLSSATKSAYS